MSASRTPSRGFTLVEFTIVAALGALIVLSLSTFYLHAQGAWLDSSLQAVTQRDATLFVQKMESTIGNADQVIWNDSSHLSLFKLGIQVSEIDWVKGSTHATVTDSMNTSTPRSTEWPATGTLRALQFSVVGADPRVVYLDSLRIETPAGEPIYLSTCFALYNKP